MQSNDHINFIRINWLIKIEKYTYVGKRGGIVDFVVTTDLDALGSFVETE